MDGSVEEFLEATVREGRVVDDECGVENGARIFTGVDNQGGSIVRPFPAPWPSLCRSSGHSDPLTRYVPPPAPMQRPQTNLDRAPPQRQGRVTPPPQGR